MKAPFTSLLLLILVTVGFASCNYPADASQSVAGGNQPPPKGWVCPQHGSNCPWVTKHRYCEYYDRHGYGSWRGGCCYQ